MSNKRVEDIISRRVLNGMWFFMGIFVVGILIKIKKEETKDLGSPILMTCLLYACYHFYAKWTDSMRPQ